MRDAFHVDPADVDLPTVLNALSDPLRLRIVDLLAHNGEMACSAIYGDVGMSKSNASHHFRILREAGLILRRHQGQRQTAVLRVKEFNDRFPGLLDVVIENS